MAKKYEYRAIVAGDFLCGARSLTYGVAVAVVRKTLAPRDVATIGRVERREILHNRRAGHDFGPWDSHRAYVVNARGTVERTDR